MKTALKSISLISFLLLITLTACRTEEIELIQAPDEEVLSPNSTVATLMQRTATNDGSDDNIIDLSNCFDVQLPVTVIVNDIEIVVSSEDDLDSIEDIFDEFDDDIDTLVIQFPITIILEDFTEVVINNQNELNSYSITCSGENESDYDIECIDFQYPISASIFDTGNELIDTITISNDMELYNFIENLDASTIVVIDFPITVILSDGTNVVINSLADLAETIENAEDDCDEDDDNDYNDDDCDNCTPNYFENILLGCSDWIVDKLERNDQDLEDNYIGYVFNFFADGTFMVEWNSITEYGTWSATGSGNNIIVDINIPSLPDCTNNWILHEIEEYTGEKKIDLRLGDDRLRYESNCN